MRIIVGVAAAAILAGCTIGSTTVEHAEATPRPPGTTVAYNVNNQFDFEQATRSANEWCGETYGKPARYLDRGAGATGDVVRFACEV